MLVVVDDPVGFRYWTTPAATRMVRQASPTSIRVIVSKSRGQSWPPLAALHFHGQLSTSGCRPPTRPARKGPDMATVGDLKLEVDLAHWRLRARGQTL